MLLSLTEDGQKFLAAVKRLEDGTDAIINGKRSDPKLEAQRDLIANFMNAEVRLPLCPAMRYGMYVTHDM